LDRDFAALQQRRIGTGADDLAGGLQIRREIPDDGRLGPDGAFFVWDVFAIAASSEPLFVGE